MPIGRIIPGNPMAVMQGLPDSDSKTKMNRDIVVSFRDSGKITPAACDAILNMIDAPAGGPPAGGPPAGGPPAGGPPAGGPPAGGPPAGGPPAGGPMGPGGRPQNPWDKAADMGLLEKAVAEEMSLRATEISHGKGVNCSGETELVYDGEDVEVFFDGDAFSTNRSGYNAIKAINGAKVHMKNVTVHKSGDSGHHECSFTGFNAGILAENGGKFYIEDSVISSDAICGNNIFAHGEGAEVNLKNCLIDAHGKASDRAVYCSWGGTLNLENCELITRGVISAVVVTDTGGGNINAKNCSLKLLGKMSGCIYSTGCIRLENCRAIANEWEGCVIVGSNSVHLKDTHVFSAKNQGVKVFTKEGDGATFEMENGSYTACEGPLLFTTGNHAHFTLKNVAVNIPSGVAFMADKTERGGDGNPAMAMPVSGINDMYVDLYRQNITGDALCDDAHTMHISLHEGSRYDGAVNTADTAVEVSVALDAGTCWNVTGESHVDVLTLAEGATVAGAYNVYYDGSRAENAPLGGKTIPLAGGGMILPK